MMMGKRGNETSMMERKREGGKTARVMDDRERDKKGEGGAETMDGVVMHGPAGTDHPVAHP